MSHSSLSTFDHVRLIGNVDTSFTHGTREIYRVVGTDGETITLLRVTDADGCRRHTGDLLRVERADLSAFESAENPDGNRSLTTVLAGQLDSLAWQLRVFGRSLVARPILSTIALAVVAVGLVGDQFLSGPDWVFGLAVFLGSLAVAALGSNLF